MANVPYFSSITSQSTFRTRFETEGAKTFPELYDVAASDWGREHLFACRVIRRYAQPNILPILAEYTQHSDLMSSAEIVKFVEGPKSAYMTRSEHHLVRDIEYGISLGQTWAAMAKLRAEQDNPRRDMLIDAEDGDESDDDRGTKRLRRRTLQDDGFIDSSMIQVGSSSPLAEGSQGTSSVGYIDSETHFFLNSPEDETLRLASSVIRHILYFAPPQDSVASPIVVEFRDAKARLSTLTPRLGRKLVATDDGGLCLREESHGAFRVSKNRVAILEAKRHFQCLEHGRPVVSDQCFAQMTCEALVARLADPLRELQHNRYRSGNFLSPMEYMYASRGLTTEYSVLLINATQHYMCFLHFEFSVDYLQDFESTAPSSFLHVTSTPWFDIKSRSGREQVILNLCGIMRWARIV